MAVRAELFGRCRVRRLLRDEGSFGDGQRRLASIVSDSAVEGGCGGFGKGRER